MTPLRVLIVDDEPPARRRLRRLLGGDAAIDVVGEAGDAVTALELVKTLRPHVVLLDIQMPEVSGLDLVQQFASLARMKPHVIFVTAHELHAIRAFELRALDYLLKPVSRPRLIEALSRVRREEPPPARFIINTNGRITVIEAADVDWIEAADNYVLLHCRPASRGEAPRSHLLRETMAGLSARLDPAQFLRIHRSAIVQVDRIERLDALGHGDWSVVLRNGRRLQLSRTHRARLMSRLKN